MTMSDTGENRADAAPELAPEHGRAGMVLRALVALALVALVVQIAIDHGGRQIRISEGGMAQEPAVPFGEPAPDFALPALDGAEVRLADQQGARRFLQQPLRNGQGQLAPVDGSARRAVAEAVDQVCPLLVHWRGAVHDGGAERELGRLAVPRLW